MAKNTPKYQEGQLVEFKDYQDLKNYVGRISNVIHSDTDPTSERFYVLNGVNFGQRNDSRLDSGIKEGVRVPEKYVIRSVEDMSVEFFLKNGWFLSSNPDHPNDFYVKNTYPIGIQHDKEANKFWAYDSRGQNRFIDVMDSLENEKEYDDFIRPILTALRGNDK